jgi:hypothetical protein
MGKAANAVIMQIIGVRRIIPSYCAVAHLGLICLLGELDQPEDHVSTHVHHGRAGPTTSPFMRRPAPLRPAFSTPEERCGAHPCRVHTPLTFVQLACHRHRRQGKLGSGAMQGMVSGLLQRTEGGASLLGRACKSSTRHLPDTSHNERIIVPLAVLFERKIPGLPAGLAETARQSRLGTELAHRRRISREG